MEEKKPEEKVDDVLGKAEETIEARDDEGKPVKLESPLEEARRISLENKELLKKIGEERQKLEELSAEIRISGKTDTGHISKKKTQEEIDQEAADRIVTQFEPE